MNNRVCIYDGTFEGLLTIVYNALKTKSLPTSIIKEGLYKTSLFESYEYVETDYRKSEKIINLISKKVSDLCLYNTYNAFLCSRKDKEINILIYLKNAFTFGKKIDNLRTIDSVLIVENMRRYVKREVHRLTGFIRFETVNQGILYSKIGPENDVLELVANHFKYRLKNEAWIIHDEKRNKAAFYDKKEIKIISTLNSDFNKLITTSSEEEYKKLWETFYNSVTIKERKNLRCQMNFMPKKYWKYMCEVNNE